MHATGITDALKETRMKSVANENKTAKKIERKAPFRSRARLEISWQVEPLQKVAILDVSEAIDGQSFALSSSTTPAIVSVGFSDCCSHQYPAAAAKI